VVKTAVPPNDTKPATYTLQEGEFPYCIARRFNVNPIELLTLNGLGGGGQYVPGLVLKIPQNNNTWPKSEPRNLLTRPVESYKVATGETIYTIACKFGDIDPLTIAKANDLVAPYKLKVNQVITIP
jgi:LysM repeat protein